MTSEQLLLALADQPLHQDKTTFKQMFEYLVSDGFFWTAGEPPNGQLAMQNTLVKVMEVLVTAIKEQK